MNQRWRTIALWVLPIGVALFLGWQVLGNGASRPVNYKNKPPHEKVFHIG
jgi:cell division protease FtsH